MALNLRTIDKAIHGELKAAAAKAGQTLESFCVECLTREIRGHVERKMAVVSPLSAATRTSAVNRPTYTPPRFRV